jgi:hypothetical protein
MKLIATDTKVTIKWFVYAGEEKIAHNSTMRGTWGYDAECSCGWKTTTGGAVKSSVREDVELHKTMEHNYTWAMSGNIDYTKVGA